MTEQFDFNKNQELEIKSKALIILGMEMLLILAMENKGEKYRKHLLNDMENLIQTSLPEIEQQYYLANKQVKPTSAIDQVKFLILNIENALDNLENSEINMHQFPEHYEDDY